MDKSHIFAVQYRGMEQLVARRAHNPKVVGSSPAPATKRKVVFITAFFYFINTVTSNSTYIPYF